MRPSVRLLFAAVLASLLGACGGPQPIGPTPVDQGIIVFMHSGFRGTSQQLAADANDLTKVQGPCGSDESESSRTWNDCISSVRVLPGWAATLYGDKNFHGAALEITEDVPDLAVRLGSCNGSYDDCISSIRVYRP
jgi:hypothetical protein